MTETPFDGALPVRPPIDSDTERAARAFIERVEQLAGAPITIVSVGPDRSATFLRQ